MAEVEERFIPERHKLDQLSIVKDYAVVPRLEYRLSTDGLATFYGLIVEFGGNSKRYAFRRPIIAGTIMISLISISDIYVCSLSILFGENGLIVIRKCVRLLKNFTLVPEQDFLNFFSSFGLVNFLLHRSLTKGLLPV